MLGLFLKRLWDTGVSQDTIHKDRGFDLLERRIGVNKLLLHVILRLEGLLYFIVNAVVRYWDQSQTSFLPHTLHRL